MSDVVLKKEDLDKILKALKDAAPKAKLGIFGNANSRSEGGSNATIGAIHEFGNSKVPRRSFLKEPLVEQMQIFLDNSNYFDKESLLKVIELKSLRPWVEDIAKTATEVIEEGFNTGGFGKWQPLSPLTISRKKGSQILVETEQLKNSISSAVE